MSFAAGDIDPSTLARENRELRKTLRLWTWGLASWAVATTVFCAWTAPLGVSDAGEPAFGLSDLGIAVVGGGFVYAVVFGSMFFHDDARRTLKLLVVSAAIPAACVVGGLVLHSKHMQFHRGFEAFDTYTGHFPRNALGEPYIQNDVASLVTVCAKQVRTTDTHFCVEVITEPKFGRKRDYVITGSFRFRERDQSGESSFIENPFDCSGDPVECEGE